MILIVDDIKDCVDSLSDIIEYSEEYSGEVKSALGGLEAIELIKKHRFKLIFCDISMPGISGHTIIGEVKARSPDSKFVFVSARGTKEDLTTGKKLKADGYLVKPYTMEEVMDFVRKWG